jgi:hypothetical protein
MPIENFRYYSAGNGEAGKAPESLDVFREEMLHDQKLSYSGQMSLDELWQKWNEKFPDRKSFFRFFGIPDPEFNGSIQADLARTYENTLVSRYEVDESVGVLDPASLRVFKEKKGKKVKISTLVLPMSEIGLGNVTAEYMDLSVNLLEKLDNEKYRHLLHQILNTLRNARWEDEHKTGEDVMSDGFLRK